MAGQLVQGKGADPGTPSAGFATTWPDINTGQMKSLDATGVKSILSPNARANYLINTGLWFAQRQAPATLQTYSATADRAYGPDQWGFTNENASVQFVQVDTTGAPEAGLQARYYGSVTKITASGKILVSQPIEASECESLRGRAVRFQCLLKATGATTLRLGVIQLTSAGSTDTIPATFVSAFGGASTDPTLGANLSYIAPIAGITGDNCSANGNAFDCSVTTAWQRFGGCFNIPTNARNVIVMIWSNAQIAAASGWSWTQAALVDGYEIQDFSPLSIADERLRCMRHYQRSFATDANGPAQNAGVNTGEIKGIAGKAGAVANAGFIFHRYQPPMRAAPGVTLFNPSAANTLMRNATGAADMGATSATGNTAFDLMVNATGVAATAVGDQVSIHFTAEAKL